MLIYPLFGTSKYGPGRLHALFLDFLFFFYKNIDFFVFFAKTWTTSVDHFFKNRKIRHFLTFFCRFFRFFCHFSKFCRQDMSLYSVILLILTSFFTCYLTFCKNTVLFLHFFDLRGDFLVKIFISFEFFPFFDLFF